MRTHEISSPSAAELYFNTSAVGYVSTLLAESLEKVRRRSSTARGTSPRDSGRSRAQPVARRAGWLDRLEAYFWRQEQKDREAYLARARDVFDLERRIKALERGMITRYY